MLVWKLDHAWRYLHWLLDHKIELSMKHTSYLPTFSVEFPRLWVDWTKTFLSSVLASVRSFTSKRIRYRSETSCCSAWALHEHSNPHELFTASTTFGCNHFPKDEGRFYRILAGVLASRSGIFCSNSFIGKPQSPSTITNLYHTQLITPSAFHCLPCPKNPSIFLPRSAFISSLLSFVLQTPIRLELAAVLERGH